jgi:transposase
MEVNKMGAPMDPKSKSGKIREMHDQGLSVSEIAKMLNLNYSFVYGVVKRYTSTKQQTTASAKDRPPSTSELIRRMYSEGHTRSEICKELGVDYSFIYNVLKKFLKEEGHRVQDH